jgi:hypothetical protein
MQSYQFIVVFDLLNSYIYFTKTALFAVYTVEYGSQACQGVWPPSVYPMKITTFWVLKRVQSVLSAR